MKSLAHYQHSKNQRKCDNFERNGTKSQTNITTPPATAHIRVSYDTKKCITAPPTLRNIGCNKRVKLNRWKNTHSPTPEMNISRAGRRAYFFCVRAVKKSWRRKNFQDGGALNSVRCRISLRSRQHVIDVNTIKQTVTLKYSRWEISTVGIILAFRHFKNVPKCWKYGKFWHFWIIFGHISA
jgi:hypothetical protein